MKKYLFLSLLLLSSCSYVEKCLSIKEDNIVEEIIEDLIKGKTGLDFDLTPSSPEIA